MLLCTGTMLSINHNNSGGSRKFWWGGFEAKTSKIRMSSPKLKLIFRPKSEIQTFFFAQNQVVSKKKKKEVLTKIETDFSAGFVTFRSVGGDASRNGAELFKIRADFSAKIVTFRLVGGDASPPSPPLNPPLQQRILIVELIIFNPENPAAKLHCKGL